MRRTLVLALLLTSCEDDDQVKGQAALERHVERNRVGMDGDHWIEMQNAIGEWERTGLIFGYLGDYDECVKAIAGLKAANPGRKYRCLPAN